MSRSFLALVKDRGPITGAAIWLSTDYKATRSDRQAAFGRIRPVDKRFVLIATLLYGLSVALCLRSLVRTPRLVRPDEAYQTLEPAFYSVFGYGVRFWEWQVGFRSWLFPDFLAAIIKIDRVIDPSHLGYLTAVWSVLAMVAALNAAAAAYIGWRFAGSIGAIICGAIVGLWPDFTLLGARTLIEIQAGNLLFLATAWSILPAAPRRHVIRATSIGALLGLTLILRFQLLPAILIILGREWRLVRSERRWLAGAFLAALGLLGVNDGLVYGAPFITIWRNIQFNVVDHLADQFGVLSMWAYYIWLARDWSLFLVPLFVLFIRGGMIAPMLPLISLTTIATHMIVPHKELTFIYPALPPALLSVALGALRYRAAFSLSRFATAEAAILVTLLVLLNMTQLTRADSLAPYDYGKGLLPLWEKIGRDPHFCGVTIDIVKGPLVGTGGYTFLGRPGQLYTVETAADMVRTAPRVNYLISRPEWRIPGDFVRTDCAGAVCVYHRPGLCAATPTIPIKNRVPVF